MSPSLSRRDVAWVAFSAFALVILVLLCTLILYLNDDLSARAALSLVGISAIALALLSLRER